METPTLEQLKQACEWCENVQWYGKYDGRFFFKGYAVVCDDSSDLAELINACRDADLQLPRPDHQDSMGLNTLFAWSTRFFEEPPVRTQHQFRTLNGEAV